LNDVNRIDEPALSALGSRGVLRLADGAVQVVVGPIADQLASEIRTQLRATASSTASSAAPPGSGASGGADFDGVLGSLGGPGNIREVGGNASRVLLTVLDASRVDEKALGSRVRALFRPQPDSLHLVVGPEASAWIARLKGAISQGNSGKP
jgi:PTS system N-acetylglucosamine-specific IIC component